MKKFIACFMLLFSLLCVAGCAPLKSDVLSNVKCKPVNTVENKLLRVIATDADLINNSDVGIKNTKLRITISNDKKEVINSQEMTIPEYVGPKEKKRFTYVIPSQPDLQSFRCDPIDCEIVSK